MSFLKKIFFLVLLINISFTKDNFYSTKYNFVNVRESPNFNSIVKFTYLKKNEPVKILYSFDNWRKIIDVDKNFGWIHVSLLSKKRYVIICGKKNKKLYEDINKKKIKAYIESGNRCRLLINKTKFLKISRGKYSGWITKSNLWGVE